MDEHCASRSCFVENLDASSLPCVEREIQAEMEICAEADFGLMEYFLSTMVVA